MRQSEGQVYKLLKYLALHPIQESRMRHKVFFSLKNTQNVFEPLSEWILILDFLYEDGEDCLCCFVETCQNSPTKEKRCGVVSKIFPTVNVSALPTYTHKVPCTALM